MLTIGILISFVIVMVGIGIAYTLEKGAKMLAGITSKLSEVSEVYSNTEYYNHMALEEITKQLEDMNKPERRINVVIPDVDTKGDYFTDIRAYKVCAEVFLQMLMNHPLEPEIAFLGVHNSVRLSDNIVSSDKYEYGTMVIEVRVNGESIYLYINTESYFYDVDSVYLDNPLMQDEFKELLKTQGYFHTITGFRIFYPDIHHKYELKTDMIKSLLKSSVIKDVKKEVERKIPGTIHIYEVVHIDGELVIAPVKSNTKGFIEVQDIPKYYPINRISYKRENVEITSSNRDKGIEFIKKVLQSESTSNMILLGEPGAGKSALLRRIFTEEFDTNLFIVVVDKQEISKLLGVEGKSLFRNMIDRAEMLESKLVLVIDNANQLITNSEEADKLATLTDGLNSSDFQLILVFNGNPKKIRKDFTNRSGRLPIEIEFDTFTPEEFVEAAKALDKELSDGRKMDFDKVKEVITNGSKLNTDLLFSCIILPIKEDPAQALFLELAGKIDEANELMQEVEVDEEVIEEDMNKESSKDNEVKDDENDDTVAIKTKPRISIQSIIKAIADKNADRMDEFV